MIAAWLVGTTTVGRRRAVDHLHVLAGPRVLDADVAGRRAVDDRRGGDHAVLHLDVDLGAVLQRDRALGVPARRDRGRDPHDAVEVLRQRLVDGQRGDADLLVVGVGQGAAGAEVGEAVGEQLERARGARRREATSAPLPRRAACDRVVAPVVGVDVAAVGVGDLGEVEVRRRLVGDQVVGEQRLEVEVLAVVERRGRVRGEAEHRLAVAGGAREVEELRQRGLQLGDQRRVLAEQRARPR